MDAPPSNPQRSWSEPRALGPAKGTLLGFPAIIPSPVQPAQRPEIAYDFERWSTPPPVGVNPIIPCDEPEDEDVVQWRPALRFATPAASPPAVFVAALVDDPVILPMRSRERGDRFYWLMSVAVVIAAASAVALRFAL